VLCSCEGQTPRAAVDVALAVWDQDLAPAVGRATCCVTTPGGRSVADLERMARTMDEWWIVDALRRRRPVVARRPAVGQPYRD
jgi:hypothetical protein